MPWGVCRRGLTHTHTPSAEVQLPVREAVASMSVQRAGRAVSMGRARPTPQRILKNELDDAQASFDMGSCACFRLRFRQLRRGAVPRLHEKVREKQRSFASDALLFRGTDGGQRFMGSDLHALRKASAAQRLRHFHATASLLLELGEGETPVLSAFCSATSGLALGLGLHSNFFVVSEETAVSLPGAAYGHVPESFALHRLSRLPSAIGSYVALTGAQLSGVELLHLGLATHLCAPHLLPRLEEELSMHPLHSLRRVKSLVDDICHEGPRTVLGAEHALFHTQAIAQCFDQPSLPAVLAALKEGDSEWHEATLGLEKKTPPILPICQHK